MPAGAPSTLGRHFSSCCKPRFNLGGQLVGTRLISLSELLPNPAVVINQRRASSARRDMSCCRSLSLANSLSVDERAHKFLCIFTLHLAHSGPSSAILPSAAGRDRATGVTLRCRLAVQPLLRFQRKRGSRYPGAQ